MIDKATPVLICGAFSTLIFLNILRGFFTGRIWTGSPGLFATDPSPWAERDIQPWGFFGAVLVYLFMGSFLAIETARMAGLITFDPLILMNSLSQKMTWLMGNKH